jgi:transcriptional regulator with XRE-family HTH domain
MPISFSNRNTLSTAFVSFGDNDWGEGCFYGRNMPAPKHDWFLSQWLAATATRQARLVELTGYPKGKVSKLVNGHQPYDREAVNDMADALNISTFELLMHPQDAMNLRQLRAKALEIAAEQRTDYRAEPLRQAS